MNKQKSRMSQDNSMISLVNCTCTHTLLFLYIVAMGPQAGHCQKLESLFILYDISK